MTCFWCHGDCGGTCLELTSSTQMRTDDPAYFLLQDGHTSTPVVHDPHCYICRDPEYAQMGMALCQPCPDCKAAGRGNGHIAADDSEWTVCGFDAYDAYDAWGQEQEK